MSGLSNILDPNEPLTRSDARMLERLSRDKAWLAQLGPEHRRAIVAKLLAGYNRIRIDSDDQAEVRHAVSILDRVVRTLGFLDQVDASREQAAATGNANEAAQGAVDAMRQFLSTLKASVNGGLA